MDSKNFGNKSRYLVFLSLIKKSLKVHFSPSLLPYCICKLSSASNLGLPHLFYSIYCKCMPSVLATFYAKLYLYKFTILFVSCHSFNSDISSSICSCTQLQYQVSSCALLFFFPPGLSKYHLINMFYESHHLIAPFIELNSPIPNAISAFSLYVIFVDGPFSRIDPWTEVIGPVPKPIWIRMYGYGYLHGQWIH